MKTFANAGAEIVPIKQLIKQLNFKLSTKLFNVRLNSRNSVIILVGKVL